ncbi:MAG TPA: galactose oxidase-like domain-containing protein [Gemmatimonadales bacterium]|nr:galactose oxidase-like domain-containing protein [Gemmatimonadales bacterium]
MTRLSHLRTWAIAALMAVGVLRCGGDNVAPPEATAVALVSGSPQTGTIAEPLPSPLVVQVTDKNGNPVSGVSVEWAAQNGGSVSQSAVETGADGKSSVTRTLGSQSGEVTTTATVSGLQGSPVTFFAVATDPSAPSLAMQTQPSSSAESGVAFDVQPVVQLKDVNGQDLSQSGLAVTATIAGSSGTLGGTTTQTTNGGGTATFTNLSITGGPGSYTLRFTAPGTNQVLSTPVTIGGSAAGSISITTNPPTHAVDAEVFDPSAQPVVVVKDASGNPVSGATVTASISSGSGTLEGTATAKSAANGTATFLDLGIRGTGDNTLQFTSGTAAVTSSPVSVSALPPEATVGQWGPVIPWDIVPLQMTLMPNSKIIAWGKHEIVDTMGMPRIWDPSAGPPTTAQMIRTDSMLFCAGHNLMPDGTLMAAGGHLQDDRGTAETNFFTPDGGFSKGPPMHHARWYPTITVLPDGKMLTMGGRNEIGAQVTTPEIWEGGQWVELPGAGTFVTPYYPRNFIDPKNGLVFYAGERIQSRWFDVNGSSAGGRGRWMSGPTHVNQLNRDYGSAVMYDAGKILYVGGGGMKNWGGGDWPDFKSDKPTATAEVINLNDANPTWQSTNSMAFARRHMNATILPDGQVLATGGTSGGGTSILVNTDPALAVHEAELWNPSTGQWTTLAANDRNHMRLYHSVAMLLPNATVLSGASGDAMTVAPNGSIVPVPPERNHEIFSPPYLFKGARPTISSAPASVSYAQTFSVVTPNAAQVTTVRWIKLGSVTHAFDSGTRANTLTFTRTATGVDVEAPSRPELAPPGYYMVFILNRNGVPSDGKIVKVQP